MKHSYIAVILFCSVGTNAGAEAMTPPAVWMKAIKTALRSELDGGTKARFSRMFYDPDTASKQPVPVCGRVTSRESGDDTRKTRFFYALVRLGEASGKPAVEAIRIGRTGSETGEIWKACTLLGLT